jgi:hypothetical protein
MLYLRRVVEASQIFLRDAHVLPKLLSYEAYYTRDMIIYCDLSTSYDIY